jgi:predicted membrane channel-forming protein YqfA (hemolysin III family)
MLSHESNRVVISNTGSKYHVFVMYISAIMKCCVILSLYYMLSPTGGRLKIKFNPLLSYSGVMLSVWCVMLSLFCLMLPLCVVSTHRRATRG